MFVVAVVFSRRIIFAFSVDKKKAQNSPCKADWKKIISAQRSECTDPVSMSLYLFRRRFWRIKPATSKHQISSNTMLLPYAGLHLPEACQYFIFFINFVQFSVITY